MTNILILYHSIAFRYPSDYGIGYDESESDPELLLVFWLLLLLLLVDFERVLSMMAGRLLAVDGGLVLLLYA